MKTDDSGLSETILAAMSQTLNHSSNTLNLMSWDFFFCLVINNISYKSDVSPPHFSPDHLYYK